MTDRDLDAEVAEKVMGLRQPEDFGVAARHDWTEDEDDEYGSYFCRRCHARSRAWAKEDELEVGPCDVAPTFYSTAIAAAWQVVERCTDTLPPAQFDMFRIAFERPNMPMWAYRAPALAAAICRAALAAIRPAAESDHD